MEERDQPMKYHEKAKLAIESMDALMGLKFSTPEERNKIIDFWRSKTTKPFDKEEYYKHTERLISHLRKPVHSWDNHDVTQGN